MKDDQHILNDMQLMRSMVEAADLSRGDVVLEVGGGPGNLSEELIKHCGRLFIVEKDSRFVKILNKKFAGSENVKVIHGDILRVVLPNFNKIITNTPYSIIQQFFVRLIRERRQNFESAILMVPHGFTTKMTAKPSDAAFGGISAMFMAFYDVDVLFEVDKNSFTPPPKVSSEYVRIKPKQVGPDKNRASYILQQIFLFDKKKVGNTLLKLFWDKGENIFGKRMTKKEAEAKLEEIFSGKWRSILNKRPAELTNDNYRVIAKCFSLDDHAQKT